MRTPEELVTAGFQALVQALGKEDAIRFVRQLSAPHSSGGDTEVEDAAEVLPALSIEEARQRILDMHDPSDQAAFL